MPFVFFTEAALNWCEHDSGSFSSLVFILIRAFMEMPSLNCTKFPHTHTEKEETSVRAYVHGKLAGTFYFNIEIKQVYAFAQNKDSASPCKFLIASKSVTGTIQYNTIQYIRFPG